LRHRHHAGAGGPEVVLQNRDIIKMFDGISVSESVPAEEQPRGDPAAETGLMRPLIALLTDFGTQDHYAGTMKGGILGICPDATLVDITTTFRARRDGRRAGARRGVQVFPAGTIFVGGRGSRRRARRAAASRPTPASTGFVAPDNGVLTQVFRETAAEKDRRADGAPLRAARP
jgi:hypothetical protein